MSVVENVHAVVSKRRGHEENNALIDNDDHDEDDIHVIERQSERQNNHENSYNDVFSSQSDSFIQQQLQSFPASTQGLDQVAERLRRSLKYYFMSPIDKWRAKGRIPWKLLLQIIKIVLATIQLAFFGSDMSSYLTQEGNMVFIHLPLNTF